MIIKTSKSTEKHKSPNKPINKVTFGDYVVTFDPMKVLLNDECCKLQPKQELILECLIVNQHKKLHKDEIKSYAWSDKSSVTDDTFWQQLLLLRNAINDSDKKIIEKVERNIYALKPKVKIHYRRTKEQKLNIIKHALAVSGLFAMAATATIQYWPKKQQLSAANFEQLTFMNGDTRSGTVSPDGNILIFPKKATGSNQWGLYAKDKKTGRISTIVSPKLGESKTIHNRDASFSPSGNKIAWIQSNFDDYCELLIADFNSKHLTVTNTSSALDCTQTYFARTPQWRTESELLISFSDTANRPNGIIALDLTVNERYELSAPDDSAVGYGDFGLYYNSDLDAIAHLRQTKTAQKAGTVDLMLYDFKTKTDKIIKSFDSRLYAVAWLNNQQLVYESSNGFDAVNLDGGVRPINLNVLGSMKFPFSMGKGKIGFIQGDLYSRNILIHDVLSKTSDSSLSSPKLDATPLFAKDTNDIIFVSQRDGIRQIFLRKATMTSPITKFKEDVTFSDLAISPDGNLIAYVREGQLTIINSEGVQVHQLNYVDNGIDFSNDSSTLLFSYKTPNGSFIEKLSMSDFSRTMITRGKMPKAGDNGEVYFFKESRNGFADSLYRISPSGGISELSKYSFSARNSMSFDIENDNIYYTKKSTNGYKLIEQSLKTGLINELISIHSNTFSLNKDASQVVASKPEPAQNNLAMFEVVNE